MVAHEIKGDAVVVYEIENTYTGQPSFMNDIRKNQHILKLDEDIKLVTLCHIQDEKGNVKRNDKGFPAQGLVCVQDATGENRVIVIQTQGGAVASAYVTHTVPYSDPKKRIKAKGPVTCVYAYVKNIEPLALNRLIGDRGASKVVASIYHGYLLNGTFWDHADDIISTFFEDSDEENVKKMIKLEHEKNKEEE